VRRLLVTASVVPSSPILVTLMKVALSSSETSVLTRAIRRNIPKDTILHSHRREILKSYISNFLIAVLSNCLEFLELGKIHKLIDFECSFKLCHEYLRAEETRH
jgi:hypothetical protein